MALKPLLPVAPGSDDIAPANRLCKSLFIRFGALAADVIVYAVIVSILVGGLR